MPVNLHQHRGAVGAFNSCFNHNNIQNSVFHRKPNVLSIASAFFAIFYKFLHISVGHKFLFDCRSQEEY